MEDRSALFNQLKEFSQRKLKKVETKVVTASGEQLVEKRGAKGLQVLSGGANDAAKETAEPPRKLDLQVGLVVPGFLIGSSDVAHDKSSLDSYGVTHILNLASDVENKFEDDYNYKNISMRDEPDYQLDKILDDCFDYIDDGRHYGNVLIHCSGTIGLSRSTTICIAYLMNKEKQKFSEAFNNVKEVRSFVKPNEGFVKQLKEYEVKLLGAQEAKDSGIDDPFAWRKKQEIEQEKAMVAGAASVKNRMKMFGATLDTTGGNNNARSKSVSPAPTSQPHPPPPNTSTSPASKWSTTTNQNNSKPTSTTTAKSMTPEPRKSWRSSADSKQQPAAVPGGPPPPPPPMPANLMSESGRANKSSLPPPPPPPPVDSLLKDKLNNNNNKPPSSRNINKTSTITTTTTKTTRKPSISSEQSSDDDGQNKKMVFGRKPPPPMKIRGGHSIERQDSNASDKTKQPTGFNKSPGRLQLPLKKQFTTDSDGESTKQPGADNPRAPSPSAALRAAKQQAAAGKSDSSGPGATSDGARRPSMGQLNRSSTKKLLNLIKTKTRTDLTLPDGDENDEIDALLGALETESIDNIDWDELGLDEDEVKDIIQGTGTPSSSSSSSSSDSSDEEEEEEDDEDEEEEVEVETSTKHYVIRSK